LLHEGTLRSIPHPGCYHRRIFFDEAGAFDTSFKIAGDYDLLARWAQKSRIATDSKIVSISMQAVGISANLESSFQIAGELIRSRRKNRLKPSFAFLWTLLRFLIRGSLAKTVGESLSRKLIDRLKLML
jgi:hypothetical protein